MAIKPNLAPVEDLPEEVWKDIPGWEGLYMASTMGRIKSLHGKRKREECILKTPLHGPYPSVTLCKSGYSQPYTVHRLILTTFKENEFDLPEIDHLKGDKLDSRLSELEYVTRSENMKRAYKLGLANAKKGEDSPSSVLKNEDVVDIFNSQESNRLLANKYKISIGHVEDIKKGKKWGHLTKKQYVVKEVKRLSKDEILSIYNTSGSLRKIASIFNVNHNVVNDIKKGRSHANITQHHVRS